VSARLLHRLLDRTFSTRLRDETGDRRGPGRLRTEREERARQAEIGFRAGGRKGEADAPRGLDDSGGDFQDARPQRCELSGGQFAGFGNGVTHGEHQPIGLHTAV
jgi:hypothetical protein